MTIDIAAARALCETRATADPEDIMRIRALNHAAAAVLPEALDEIERLRTLEEQRLGGPPCTVCGHIIDWKGHCACDDEYLGVRGGKGRKA
jgi:hypothetical protein